MVADLGLEILGWDPKVGTVLEPPRDEERGKDVASWIWLTTSSRQNCLLLLVVNEVGDIPPSLLRWHPPIKLYPVGVP